MEEVTLASLSLTLVHYNPNDPLSHLAAWLALAPQALCVIYVTLIWASREVEILLMFIGQMGCEALNFLLKRWIKEERPPQMYDQGYGMPSSHSQFVAYFSVFACLFLLLRHAPHPSITHSPIPFSERLFFSFIAFLCAAAVALSRIYLSYHTPKQVGIGCAIGAICAISWFIVITFLRRSGWIRWALDTNPLEQLRMRDLVVTEHLVEAGWVRWLERRQDHRRQRNGRRVKFQ